MEVKFSTNTSNKNPIEALESLVSQQQQFESKGLDITFGLIYIQVNITLRLISHSG